MVSTVIVPLDGSERSTAALVPACAIAERTHAAMLLLTAASSGTRDDSARRELCTRAHAIQSSSVVLPTVELRALRNRDVPDAIAGAARHTPGGMVCMATRGDTRAGVAVLGRVARAVVRRGVDSLLLVGPRSRPDWSLPEHPRIIVCVDELDDGETIVDPAGDLAIAVGASALVVHVEPPGRRRPSGAAVAAQRSVDRAAKLLADRGVPSEGVVLEGAETAGALVALCESTRDVAFVALSAHGRTGVPLGTLGSVAMDVVRHAPVPVLVHRPDRRYRADEA